MQTKKLITAEFIFYGQEPNLAQIEMWANELNNFNSDEISKAYSKLRNSFSKVPTPAQLKNVLFNYPSADEAWGWIPKHEDDASVWCDPIRLAYFSCCDQLKTDEIAARMIFKSVYDSEVLNAKARCEKAKWVLSEGLNKSSRDSILRKAIDRGYLKPKEAVAWSPEIALPPSQQVLLEAPKETFTEAVREENMKKFREILNAAKKIPTE